MTSSGGAAWTRRGVLAAGAAGLVTSCRSESPGSSPSPTPTTTPTTPAPTPPTWARLARSVEGRLLLPREPAYDVARLLQNPRFDDQRPLAVLTVASARDVATAIGFARERGLPVAVRSGGHSYPGWSGGGSPRALVLDCRALSTVDLATDGTASIGAGAALAPVYDTLGRRGRAIAGGSCATVGIAGLTLGGGVGVLTRDLGLTCDAVTAMEVVTADGRIRRVTADDDPDLFWALRGGGGGHLGVVTSFEMRTSAAPAVGSAFLQWPLSAAPDVLPAWQAWAPGADPRLWSTTKALGGTKHPDGPVLLVSATWTGPADAFAAQLAGLLDHVPAPGVRVDHRRTYRDAMLAYAGCTDLPIERCTTAPGGGLTREAFGATSHVAYGPLPDAGVAALVRRVEDAAATGLLEAGISIDALGGRVRDLAPDATAFVHREALATVQYTATYAQGPATPADAYVRGFRSAMTPWWGQHAYVNYADATIEDPATAYFGANAGRLRSVRETYDPDRFFTQPQDY